MTYHLTCEALNLAESAKCTLINQTVLVSTWNKVTIFHVTIQELASNMDTLFTEFVIESCHRNFMKSKKLCLHYNQPFESKQHFLLETRLNS